MPRYFSLSIMASRFLSALLRRNAAQCIIGAEFEDDALGAVGNRPVDPRQPARRRVARNAGIGDRDIDGPLSFKASCRLPGKASPGGSW